MIRYDWLLWLAVLLIAATFLATSALANGFPCPAKGQACWKVKAAVVLYGEAAVESHVRSCGWTDREIEQAKRCLRK